MIVWSGFGGLAFVIIAAATGLGFLFSSGLGSQMTLGRGLILALMYLIAAAGIWFWGRHLNVTGVQKRIDAHLAQRSAYYDQLIQSGQFQVAMQLPQAPTPEQARAIADQQLQAERTQLVKRARQPHTMFWIPMQWWAVAAVIAAVIAVIVGVQSLSQA